MKVSVVIPWRAGDPNREASLNFVTSWYQQALPEAEIIFADDDDEEGFNRGRALNIGVAQSSGDVLVLADGDLLIPQRVIQSCVNKAHDFGMIIPFSSISYLSHSSSKRVIAGNSPFTRFGDSIQFPTKSQGGCNIMTRENFDKAGGFDKGFRGWGFEDAAFSVSVRLYAGPLFWEPGSAVHLHHTPARDAHHPFYKESKALCTLYEDAINNSKQVSSKEDKNYCIKPGYKHRTSAPDFNDTTFTDEYQKEVYAEASRLMVINGWNSVIDVGCGSGYKLINQLGQYKTLGLDIPSTVKFLKEKYPDRQWDNALTTAYELLETNLVISSDVIEHVKYPDEYVQDLLDIECNMFLISTPDRDVVRGTASFGPPENVSHYREWNQTEFKNFLSLWFNVEHIELVHASHGTMLAWLTRKKT